MRKVGFLLVLSAILIALSACGGSKDNGNASPAPTQSQTPAESQAPADTGAAGGGAVNAEEAQSVYQSNCMACHAADLSGGMGPGLKDIGARMSQDQIAGIIANGQGRMPAFSGRLSDDQVNNLAAWLATQKG